MVVQRPYTRTELIKFREQEKPLMNWREGNKSIGEREEEKCHGEPELISLSLVTLGQQH